MKTCSICSHNQRKEIETLMVSGVALRRIAPQFGTSEKTLRRHRQCIARILQNAELAKQLETIATVKEVLEALTWQMRSNALDLFDEQGQFSLEDIRRRGLGKMLKSITFRREANSAEPVDVVKIEIHSQQLAAMALLNAYTKLEITKQLTDAHQLSDRERAERIAAIFERARNRRGK